MSCSAQQNKMVEDREPVDPNDPYIKEIADWAVKEYNKEHGTCLKFERVLKAEREARVGCTMYYIDLEASSNDNIWQSNNKYFAKVSEMLCNATITRSLESFERIAVAN